MTDLIAIQGLPFLACLAMLSILGYVGLHVLKREVIFIDITLAQVAAVGAIGAHVLFKVHADSLQAQATALGATLLAAAFFAIMRRRVREIPLEAIIGVSYAIAAAGALFLVGIAPGGHSHIQDMLSGSILWVTPHDFLVSIPVLVAVGACFYLFRKPFHAISDDYEGAAAVGFNTLLWDFLFYVLVGIVITTVVRIGGVVLVFCFLIIPATVATMLASSWRVCLLLTWAIGSAAAAAGLTFAARLDFSVGPAIALWLGITIALGGLGKSLKSRSRHGVSSPPGG